MRRAGRVVAEMHERTRAALRPGAQVLGRHLVQHRLLQLLEDQPLELLPGVDEEQLGEDGAGSLCDEHLCQALAAMMRLRADGDLGAERAGSDGSAIDCGRD